MEERSKALCSKQYRRVSIKDQKLNFIDKDAFVFT